MITDETRSLNPVAMGDKAEKLIGISVHRLFQAEQEVLLFSWLSYKSEKLSCVTNYLSCQWVVVFNWLIECASYWSCCKWTRGKSFVVRAVKGALYTIVTVYDANEIGSNTCWCLLDVYLICHSLYLVVWVIVYETLDFICWF